MLRRVNGWFNTNVLLLIVHNMLLVLYIVYVYTRPVNIGLWMISFLIRDDRTNEQISYRQTDRQTDRRPSHTYTDSTAVSTLFTCTSAILFGNHLFRIVQIKMARKTTYLYRVMQKKSQTLNTGWGRTRHHSYIWWRKKRHFYRVTHKKRQTCIG